MKDSLKRAQIMARKSIYDDARYLGEWRGFEVFEPTFADNEPRFIGFPQFILAKSGEVRWSTDAETRPIMSAFASDEE